MLVFLCSTEGKVRLLTLYFSTAHNACCYTLLAATCGQHGAAAGAGSRHRSPTAGGDGRLLGA